MMTKPLLSSMTAFSRVEETLEDVRIRFEAKSLNHRHLELKVRLPRHWSALESNFKSLFQKEFSRGVIEIKADIGTESHSDVIGFEPNLSLAAEYAESIQSLQKALGIDQPITTQDLLQSGELVTKLTSAQKLAEDEEALFSKIEPILKRLIQSLKEMRQKEGSRLKTILLEHLKKVKSLHGEIVSLKEKSKENFQNKVETKIKKVFETFPITELSSNELLESRITQELAIIIDRTDIEEEINRIESHIDHFEDILKEGSPIGRKLEFMIQEFHREVNTLGNKAQDFEIGKKVIELKTTLEQMREQVLNVE